MAVPEVKGVAMRSTHPGMEASQWKILRKSAVPEVKRPTRSLLECLQRVDRARPTGSLAN